MEKNIKKNVKKLLVSIAQSSQNTTSASVIMYHPTFPQKTKKW